MNKVMDAFPRSDRKEVEKAIREMIEKKGKPNAAALMYINGEDEMLLSFRYEPETEDEKKICETYGFGYVGHEICFYGGVEKGFRIFDPEPGEIFPGQENADFIRDAYVYASMPAVLLELRDILDECGLEDVAIVTDWEERFESLLKGMVPGYEEVKKNAGIRADI